MDRPGVRQVPEGSGELGKMEETGCEIICGAPTTHADKGLMMMMMTIRRHIHSTAVCALNDDQELLVWSDCLLDLGTDFLVGNMVFV